MADWKENKLVGIAAAVILIVAIVLVVKQIKARNEVPPEAKQEILQIHQQALQETEQYKFAPGEDPSQFQGQ